MGETRLTKDLPAPGENDSIECHLQAVGMGSLICRAAQQTGDKTTNEVTPEMCFNCPAGKVYREVGCDAVLPKLRVYAYLGGGRLNVEQLFCRVRRRVTDLEYCSQCGLATAETTREMITQARGLFETRGFHSAYKDIEKARKAILENIPMDKKIVTICYTGHTASQTAMILNEIGYEAYSLAYSYMGWTSDDEVIGTPVHYSCDVDNPVVTD